MHYHGAKKYFSTVALPSFSVNRLPREIPLLYYYYGLLYSVEACLLTLNSVNKTTLPGYNTKPRQSVAEFVQESIIFCSTCTMC